MNRYYQGRKLPFSNPLANALVVLVGALAIGASIVLGFIAFVTLGSLILIMAAIIGIRVWWFNRKLARQMKTGRNGSRSSGSVHVHVIEGEFRDVSRPSRPERDGET